MFDNSSRCETFKRRITVGGDGENANKSVEQRLGLDLTFLRRRALPFRKIQICATFAQCHGKTGHTKLNTKGEKL